MFKPSTRSSAKSSSRSNAGFAQTQFLHEEADEDYSGFAPTEMFDDDLDAFQAIEAAALKPAAAPLSPAQAASSSHTVLARAAQAAPPGPRGPLPAEEALMPASWVTSKWVEAQENKAHEAARQARELIAAQRRTGSLRPRGAFGCARAALERLLPVEFRSLLPLFICVSVTMALIAAVLPLFDKF
jgi:hypothetical protein